MAGGLTIDFGNCYTVAAYWRQDVRQAEVLYIPGITRPIPGNVAGQVKRIYAAPSLIRYVAIDNNEIWLIGHEALEGLSGVAAERNLFSHLQSDVITGKKVYYLAGSRRLSGQDIARDYLASLISRAGQALGLASEAVIAFTMPAAACQSETIWQRYRRWLETTTYQAGFSRLELIEQPWAAAKGSGMPLKPGAVYSVVTIHADSVETVIVQAVNGKEQTLVGGVLAKTTVGSYSYIDIDESSAFAQNRENKRHLRVLSCRTEWLIGEEPEEATRQLAATIQQALQDVERRGYSANCLTGVVVIGSSVNSEILGIVHDLFGGIPVYANQPFSAAACGGAALLAGEDACGYISHRYGLRFLTEAGYQYRELVTKGMFYPSTGTICEFTVKASYNGQQKFALFIYRLEDGLQCINEKDPLILTIQTPAVRGQAVFTVKASLDSAGQLLVTATAVDSGEIFADRVPVAKLV